MTVSALALPAVEHRAGLEDALARWLPRRRWYADKDRVLSHVRILHATAFTRPGAARTGVFAVVRAHFADDSGAADYLVPLALGPVRATLPGGEDALVARLGMTEFSDALAEPGLATELVRRLASADGESDAGLVFAPEPPGFAPPGPEAGERALAVEQSNSSVVVAGRHLIKVFRRLSPGTNPELDAQRLLRAGECPDVPRLEGAIHGPLGPHTATYAVVQQYVPDAEDGWAFALRCVQAAIDGRADDDGLAELSELGAAIARVHAVLAAQAEIGPLTAAVRRRLAAEMTERLEQAVALAPELAGRRAAVAGLYAMLGSRRARPGGMVQRVHGDLHLGQVLRAGTRWYVVDFEGEPAAPFDQRTALHPPERDLAGMLRSLDYAAEYAARGDGPAHAGDARAAAWAARAARALRAGYRSVAGLGPDPLLLAACQTDKAVYELCYEMRNRPDWAAIPRRGLERLLAGPRDRPDQVEREQRSARAGR